MIRHVGRLFATMFLASVPALGAPASGGPAGADDSQAKPPCVALLTADELLKGFGDKFRNALSKCGALERPNARGLCGRRQAQSPSSSSSTT